MSASDHPSAIEVAVSTEGTVIINYYSQTGVDGWGHFSFTIPEAEALIQTLQEALLHAKRVTGQGHPKLN